jgi:hypothetical protein
VSSASPLAAFPFAATTPTSTCDFSGTCVAPIPAASCSHPSIGITSCASDPVSLAAASSANNQVDLYSAGSGSGEGDLCLASGSATSVGCVATTSAAFFDLGLPASARAEGYASASLVLTVSSGP